MDTPSSTYMMTYRTLNVLKLHSLHVKVRRYYTNMPFSVMVVHDLLTSNAVAYSLLNRADFTNAGCPSAWGFLSCRKHHHMLARAGMDQVQIFGFQRIFVPPVHQQINLNPKICQTSCFFLCDWLGALSTATQNWRNQRFPAHSKEEGCQM